jgi:LPXTG-motif cell wall-anchored protein
MRIPSLAHTLTAAAAGAAASFALAATASAAQGTIPINPGNVPATAAGYEQECSAELGGGPYPGKDVWVFNLPGNADTTGDFTSISAVFDTDHDSKGDTTVLIDPGASDGDDIVTVGHSKAYAITAAGWTLVDASATITGVADKFVLTHTCAASGATTPPTTKPATTPPTTKPATTPPTTKPTGGTPTSSPTQDTPATTPSESTGSGTGGTGSGGETPGGLALTGANAGGAAVLGLLLIGGGAALVLRRRRRFVA